MGGLQACCTYDSTGSYFKGASEQDAISDMRRAFNEVECPLRPRLFLAMPLQDGMEEAVDAAQPTSAAEGEDSMSSPEKNLEKTEVLYLKMETAIRGVLQVHQAGLLTLP